jgi:hypothetical protein
VSRLLSNSPNAEEMSANSLPLPQPHVGNLYKYMRGFIRKDREFVINMVAEELSLPNDTKDRLMIMIASDDADTPHTTKPKRHSSRGAITTDPKTSEDSNNYVMMEVFTKDDVTYLVDGDNNLYTYNLEQPEKVGILLVDGNVKINPT